MRELWCTAAALKVFRKRANQDLAVRNGVKEREGGVEGGREGQGEREEEGEGG